MSKLKIDKNVPVPAVHAFKQTPRTKLLRSMEKGDSVLVTDTGKNARQCWRDSAAYIGFRVITRKEGKGFRLWRGEDIKRKGAA